MRQIESFWGAVIGLVIATVAIVGTQSFEWEWGTTQRAPTIIGGVAAAVAVVIVVRRVGGGVIH